MSADRSQPADHLKNKVLQLFPFRDVFLQFVSALVQILHARLQLTAFLFLHRDHHLQRLLVFLQVVLGGLLALSAE